MTTKNPATPLGDATALRVATATIRGKGRLTIPQEIRDAVSIKDGQVMQFVVIDPHTIQLRPVEVVSRDQAWFWTEGWQQAMKESLEDVKAGRVDRFDSDEEFMASLGDD
jgi:bifunctional DNA-binding transcriptional regulator/antitoxin component of YhaV-PrlF toxin-antitoxin module